eukprot:Nk52_evm52s62 gene=Nk52_evmTU52s62
MFKKDFHVRANVAMRNKEQKALKTRIQARFGSLREEELDLLFPKKSQLYQAKVDLVNVRGGSGADSVGDYIAYIYLVDGQPLFFEIQYDERVFPTVYALWRVPSLIKYFITHPYVFERIQGGAALFLNGTVQPPGGSGYYAGLERDAVVAVSVGGVNGAAMVVGSSYVCERDLEEIGFQKHGVLPIHMVGDYLYMMGDKSHPPVLPLPFSAMVRDSEEIEQEGEEGETNTDAQVEGVGSELSQLGIGGKDEEEEREKEEESDAVNEEFLKSFLEGLLACPSDAFPILGSTFASQHMKGGGVKATKWKKYATFWKAMEKDGVIKTKAYTKGNSSIVSYEANHPLMDEVGAKQKKVKSAGGGKAAKMPASGKRALKIEEFYRPVGKQVEFFKDMGIEKGTLLSKNEVRDIINRYAEENNLVDPESRGDILISAVLSSSVVSKKERDAYSLPRATVVNSCLKEMSPHYSIQFGEEPLTLRKGVLKPIIASQEQRMGRKFVTVVKGLENFGIDPAAFASSMQKRAACSTSVFDEFEGKVNSPKQVLIQGKSFKLVMQELEGAYDIPKKYIEGIEKGKALKK